MRSRVLVLVGATAVGKTGAAIELARLIGGEIVSADSVAVYKGLNIGSAKPTPEEQERAVFHLIDVVEPQCQFSAGDFQKLAHRAIMDILERDKWAIVTGGSGLYVKAAIDGLNQFLPEEDESLRARLYNTSEIKGRGYVHRILQRIDRVSAQRIPAGNLKRVVRAIEISLGAGRPASEIFQEDAARPPAFPGAAFFGLHLPREKLRERIDSRVEQMVNVGFIEEVQDLMAAGLTPQLLSMQSLGYKEMIQYLSGTLTVLEAIEEMKTNTRRFAKRQDTWFRADKRISWIDTTELNTEQIAEKIKEKLEQ